MSQHNPDAARDERILIYAPTGRDAALTAQLLNEVGLLPHPCATIRAFFEALQNGGAVGLVTAEALSLETVSLLCEALRQQPTWSDTPLFVLTGARGQTPSFISKLATLNEAGNVTIIERPVRRAMLLSTLKSALRARHRQYDLRNHLIEQFKIKEDLRVGEERLRIAMDAAQLGAWQLDFFNSNIECNSIFKAHFGLAPDNPFSYDSFIESIHPDDIRPIIAAIESVLDNPKSFSQECRVFWPDKTLRWLLISGRANYDTHGSPYSMVGVTLDISERKKIEVEREHLLESERTARAEAEASSRLKDDFLATVSHELRTPLMAILGWANLLRTKQVDESMITAALETIERNARSQVQLINDLLDVSSIISGKLRLDVEELELVTVVHGSIDAVRLAAEAKRIELSLQLQPDSGVILGDAERLQQVVWNLLSNAVKFTPSGGKIEVGLTRLDRFVEISVRDSGQGIPLEFLPYVFDRFRQADQTSTRKYGGLGIGLAIVRQLVELHGGTIRVTSDGIGTGALFVLQLPLSVERGNMDKVRLHQLTKQTPPLSIDLPNLDHLRVLIVDDETDTRTLLAATLENSGSEVVTAASVTEALALFEKSRPDIVISDIGMPGQDGYELIKKIRSSDLSGTRVPVIALTAYVRVEDQKRALAAGFDLHIAKPVDPEVFVKAVAQLAEQTQASSR